MTKKDWKVSAWTFKRPTRTQHLRRGRWAEAEALAHLKRNGLRLLEQNFRSRYGEIDLVMIDPEQTIVFVEVRFRACNQFGDGLDSVDRRKQLKLRRTAEHFLCRFSTYAHYECRFDVVSIGMTKQNQPQIDWLCDAFQ